MSYEYEFAKEDCIYYSFCGKKDEDDCNEACIRYMEMHYLLHHSLIPKAKHKLKHLTPDPKDIESFEFLEELKNDILNFVKNGEGLYIYSDNFGNGKTAYAIKLMQVYFDKIWAGNGFRTRGLFIHVPTFLNNLKNSFGGKNEETERIKRELPEVDLVIWDDIASTSLSEYDHSILLTYLDQRILQEKANIYTGNLSNESLFEALGNRLGSRIWNHTSLVQFISGDRRGA